MSVLKVNKDNFKDEVLNSDKPVLITFYMDGFNDSAFLSPVLEEISEEKKDDLKVVKINAKTEPELMSKYGLNLIPAMTVMQKGQILFGTTGYLKKNSLNNWLKSNMSKYSPHTAKEMSFVEQKFPTELREEFNAAFKHAFKLHLVDYSSDFKGRIAAMDNLLTKAESQDKLITTDEIDKLFMFDIVETIANRKDFRKRGF